MSTWRDCKDSLPHDGQTVYFVRDGVVHVGRFEMYEGQIPVFQPGRYWHPENRVTHWMAHDIPRPPNASLHQRETRP